MNRRTLGLALTLFTLCPAWIGCQSPHRKLRPHDNDPDPAKASSGGDAVESTKVLDVQADPVEKKPFFRSSRLPSGLSDEAREIESHVGVH